MSACAAQVCEDFGLQTRTVGLAVGYFERFVSVKESIVKQQVQLLAVTCVLIAAKFVEIKMPCLDDLCEVAHKGLAETPEAQTQEAATAAEAFAEQLTAAKKDTY